MSTRIIYNGVEFSYVRVRTFREEPVTTQDNSVDGDYLFTHYTIGIDAVVNRGLSPALPGEEVGDTQARLQYLLAVQRAPLQFFSGNKLLIESPPADAKRSTQAGKAVDARNGPIVKNLVVRQFSAETLLVSFEVHTWLVRCEHENRKGLISNRWSTRFEIDQLQYVKIVTNGRAITRSDMNVNPDALRGVVAPSLPTQFVNLRSTYTVQNDGLALDYMYEDAEVYRVPPSPCYRVAGSFRRTSSMGAVTFAHINLKCWALRTYPNAVVGRKDDLFTVTIGLAVGKLTGGLNVLNEKAPDGRLYVLKQFVVEQFWEENAISITMTAQTNPPGRRLAGKPTNKVEFASNAWYGGGQNVDVKFLPGPTPLLYGTAALQANVAYLRDPCDSRGARVVALATPRQDLREKRLVGR